MTAALELAGISKTFGSQKALDDVTISIPPGRVTALLGQNGSGKSTLIKILAGFYEPEPGGSLKVNGREIALPAVASDVHDAGVRFLHQDLALVPELSVLDNLALANGYRSRGLRRINDRRHRDDTAELLRRFDIDVPPDTLVGDLSPSSRTMVAIARAFAGDAGAGRVIILDEPTASLPRAEVERVFVALRPATAAGASIVYVSHRLDEVQQISDHVLVLRDGRLVADTELGDMSESEIVRLILGRDVAELPANSSDDPPPEDVILRARGITGPRLSDVSFDVRQGEILGVTGLLGCGRSELARMLCGVQVMHAGQIQLGGRELRLRTPADAFAEKIAYVPQDRRHHAVLAGMTLRENLTLPTLPDYWSRGRISERREHAVVADLIRRFDVRPPLPDRDLANFSGGNQQKAILARCVSIQPRLLVVDEPTQGVDAGARQEIGALLLELAASGVAVVLCSSDYAELAALCNRVLVLDRGHLKATLTGADVTEGQLTATCAAGSGNQENRSFAP